MKSELKIEKKIILSTLLVLIQCLFFDKFFGFQLKISISISLLQILVMLKVYRHIQKNIEESYSKKQCILFKLITVISLAFTFYFLEQASYIEQISYIEWLRKLGSRTIPSIDFEIGTTLIINYFIFLVSYIQLLKAHVADNIISWFPSIGGVIMGLGLNVYFNSNYNHVIKNNIIIVGSSLLILYMLYLSKKNAGVKRVTYINTRSYLVMYFIAMTLIVGGGTLLPEIRELPGTRWLHHIFNSFSSKSNLVEWVPGEINLSNDVPYSEVEIFEIQATEPLYIRDMAYNIYDEGKWYIEDKRSYEENMHFDNRYLEAEYTQLDAFLEEIIWLNSKDEKNLPEYKWLANYEKNIVTEKRYKVIRNPINKINYLTVNGLKSIIVGNDSNVYYYKKLNNNYFYGDVLIEPSEYEIIYYNHVPKVGSREYTFLHSINEDEWQQLYNKVVELRRQYHLEYEITPKLLITYTQKIQYENAQNEFLQVPNELEDELKQYTQYLVRGYHSTLGQVEAIERYLKQNYTYNLHNTNSEGERVHNFLFETKRGICQDFATSMVLMCRSIGVPAKYVTGYLVHEKNSETGHYIVREKDAHAFVEVYIAGYGWMQFDPTPMEESSIEEQVISEERLNNRLEFVLAIIIILALLVFSGIGRSYIKDKGWQMAYLYASPEKKIKLLLKKTLLYLQEYDYQKEKYETLTQYTIRLKQEDIEIEEITKSYEKQKYGHIVLTKQEVKKALQCYKALKKHLKTNKNRC